MSRPLCTIPTRRFNDTASRALVSYRCSSRSKSFHPTLNVTCKRPIHEIQKKTRQSSCCSTVVPLDQTSPGQQTLSSSTVDHNVQRLIPRQENQHVVLRYTGFDIQLITQVAVALFLGLHFCCRHGCHQGRIAKSRISLHHRAPITPFGLGSVEFVWSTKHARIDSEPMWTTAAGAPCDTTSGCSDSFPCRCRGRRRRRCCLTRFMQAAVLFVLVEPASPPAVELLAEAFVRFLALCPPWLSVVRNPLLSLGNHLRFCQHSQCSAIHCVQSNSPAGRFRTERGLPARPSHNQQRRQQPHAYATIGMISLSVDPFLSADSFASHGVLKSTSPCEQVMSRSTSPQPCWALPAPS